MVRTNQGGSILGFIVIGGVMAVLLVGGAYFVRQNLMSKSDDGPVVVEDIDGDENGDYDGFEEEPSTDQDESGSQEEQDEDDDRGDAGVTSPEEPTNTGALPEGGQSVTSPETLPQTGIGGVVLSSFLVSGIVAAAVAYLRSRALSVSL